MLTLSISVVLPYLLSIYSYISLRLNIIIPRYAVYLSYIIQPGIRAGDLGPLLIASAAVALGRRSHSRGQPPGIDFDLLGQGLLRRACSGVVIMYAAASRSHLPPWPSTVVHVVNRSQRRPPTGGMGPSPAPASPQAGLELLRHGRRRRSLDLLRAPATPPSAAGAPPRPHLGSLPAGAHALRQPPCVAQVVVGSPALPCSHPRRALDPLDLHGAEVHGLPSTGFPLQTPVS